MAGVKVKDVREKYDRFVELLYTNKDGQRLDVGIQPERAALEYERGVTIIEVAIWNEFGTKTIPSRSWLRGWFQENQNYVTGWLLGEFKRVARGEQTKVQALQRVGEKCVASIKQRIVARIPPPNAPSTIAKKGSNVPLIDTGIFLGSIGAKVK